MRISDWSSDVCSSDLIFRHAGLADPGDRDPVPGGLPAPDRAGLPDRRVRHEEAAAAALPGSRGGGVLAFGVRPAGTALPLAAAQVPRARGAAGRPGRSEERTSELQSPMRNPSDVLSIKKKIAYYLRQ